MRKGENPWESKPLSSCSRGGGLVGRMDPRNARIGMFCRDRKVPVPKSSPHLPFRRVTVWGPFPFQPPATPRLFPLWSVPRAGGWEQLSES